MADYSGTIVTQQPVLAGVTDFPAGQMINTAGPVQYAQRVYSSGLSVWCYYVGAINASPLSSQTTPNWTGTITAYQLLGQI